MPAPDNALGNVSVRMASSAGMATKSAGIKTIMKKMRRVTVFLEFSAFE